ncbi:MAG: hypothetical protein AB1730_10265 [Myxococcota bacterium]
MTNQTMMFGAPSGGAPAAAPPAAGKQTMVFGVAGGGAPAAPPSAASKQTMVFGAPAAGSQPAPAAAGKQTMVFGAPAAGSHPAPAAAGKQTMVFGAPAAGSQPAPAAAGQQTMVFGAPAPGSQPAPAAAGKQTMVFGAPAAGSQSAPPTAPGKQTMVFGAPAAPPAAGGPANKQTMVFGAVAPAVAPVSPSSTPSRNQTMMFGRAPGTAPAPRVSAAAAEAGALGEEVRERSESTVRVDLEAMMRGQGEDFEGVQARHDRTQRYAMTDQGQTTSPGAAVPTAETPEEVQARHNRTQTYAMTTQQETTRPDAAAPSPDAAEWGHRSGDSTLPPSFAEMPTLEPDAPPPPAVNQTLVFGAQGPRANVTTDPGLDPPGVRVLLEPGMMTPPDGAAAARREPLATTIPNLSPLQPADSLPPLRVELPPEPAFTSTAQTERYAPVPNPTQDDAAMAELRRTSSRRTAVAVIAFLVIALGLGLAVLWHLFGRSLLGGGADAASRAKIEAAVAQLRMDDAESRENAMAQLREVLAAHPESIPAQASLVLAQALAYDDAAVLHDARHALAKQGLSTEDAVNEARTRKTRAELALKNGLARLEATQPAPAPGSADALMVLRASAVALGALGDARALELAEAFRQASPGPDDWAELAMPEYAATAGTTVTEALEQLEAIGARGSNSTFFRVLVLRARLLMKEKELAKAEEPLKTVTTLNSKHEVAAVLLQQLNASKPGTPSAARQGGLDGE